MLVKKRRIYIKSYTDIEQSKKLAEILPLESADLAWYPSYAKDRYSIRKLTDTYPLDIIGDEHDELPAWSLAALLGVLPKSLIYTPNQALDGYCCKNIMYDLETYGDNPVDACYEMIIKLHEQKLL